MWQIFKRPFYHSDDALDKMRDLQTKINDLEEEVVMRLVAGGYKCTLLTKRGNRRLIKMEWGAGVDLTIAQCSRC